MAYNLENYDGAIQYTTTPSTAKNWTFSGNNTYSGASAITGTLSIAVGRSIASGGGAAVQIGGYGTATVAGGSVVINQQAGQITTTSLTTGTLTAVSFDLVNSFLGSAPQVFFQCYNGTNSTGVFVLSGVTTSKAGSITVTMTNVAVTPANGTVLLDFDITKS